MKHPLLAVSERLNVTNEHLAGTVGPMIFFNGKLEPQAVLEAVEAEINHESHEDLDNNSSRPSHASSQFPLLV